MDRETQARNPNAAGHSSDLELLRGTAAGCEESFRLLFRRWAPKLGRFLAHTTGSRETGEDLLQEAFLRILQAAPRFEPRGKVSSWMYRICANLAYSHWRRRRAAPVFEPWEWQTTAQPPAPIAEGPERTRMRRAIAHDAREALLEIPENQRMVFLLKVDQGLTYEQVAVVLQCPVGTAKSRFHHAVRKLRELLRDWDEESPGGAHSVVQEDRPRNEQGDARADTGRDAQQTGRRDAQRDGSDRDVL